MADSGKLAMFGKSYNTQGDNKAHLCLCTVGDVVVKTPQRFIKIFEGGKLKVEDQQILFTAESEDDINKDGIWLVTTAGDEGEGSSKVYLNLDGNKILLASTTDGYISYTSVQSLTADQFVQALENIGFYYQTLDQAKAGGITDGLVYILNENKVYKVINGEYVDLESTIIQTAVSSVQDKTYDTLQIGGIFIDGINNTINTESGLTFQIDGSDYILLQGGTIYIRKNVVLDTDITVKTDGASKGSSGLYIYKDGGEITLEVDNLVVHNSTDSDEPLEPGLTDRIVSSSTMNIIRSAEWDEAPTRIRLDLKYDNAFADGDNVAVILGTAANVVSFSWMSDNEEETRIIEAELSRAPKSVTVLDARYTYYLEDDEDLYDDTVEIVIDPNDHDEDEDDNRFGYANVPYDRDIDEVIGVTVKSGDDDIRFSASGTATSPMPSTVSAKVVGTDPVVIEVDNTDSSDSLLESMRWTIISFLGRSELFSRTIELRGGALSAVSYTESDGEITGTEKVRIDATNGLYAEGLSVVSSVFSKYPTMDGGTEVPDDAMDDGYDKWLPSVGWVKEIVRTMIEEASESRDEP